MVIGALIDAGADPHDLEQKLKKLQIEDEYELSWDQVNKNGITSTKFNVILKNGNHDGMKTHHHHRAYRQIVQMIEAADFSERVQMIALNIFKKIGKAEAHIHGVPLEDVHFHEVGAVDSMIDIVGTAILVDQLKVDQIKSSPIPVGSGKIHIDHGIYPVPAPATLEIMRGIPIAKSKLKAELTTPTGAAIANVLAEKYCTMPPMIIESIGYGAGTRSFSDHPNVLRVVIGDGQK